MTLSKHLVGAATSPDPHGRRAGTVRVLANALLVLLAYEVVSMGAAAAQVVLTGWTPRDLPIEGVPLVAVIAVFLLVAGSLSFPVCWRFSSASSTSPAAFRTHVC